MNRPCVLGALVATATLGPCAQGVTSANAGTSSQNRGYYKTILDDSLIVNCSDRIETDHAGRTLRGVRSDLWT